MDKPSGVFYYPNPANRKVRMYVKEEDGQIWFRLYNADDPDLWEDHGWVPYKAIQKAKKMYTGSNFDPDQAYDVNIAKTLLKDAGK
jgi:hypothetical protein